MLIMGYQGGKIKNNKLLNIVKHVNFKVKYNTNRTNFNVNEILLLTPNLEV